ncbi:hypothetical protein P4200_30530 [Pseudomonas aeruginosa]|nr:hypothetical protein [Pseudomonas aeruginosa]
MPPGGRETESARDACDSALRPAIVAFAQRRTASLVRPVNKCKILLHGRLGTPSRLVHAGAQLSHGYHCHEVPAAPAAVIPLSALADDKDYDQCILDYQRTAKSGVAVHFITQACDKLYNDGSFLLSREKAYYECLLENLPGVENNLAAQKIRSACESKSQN